MRKQKKPRATRLHVLIQYRPDSVREGGKEERIRFATQAAVMQRALDEAAFVTECKAWCCNKPLGQETHSMAS